jgi:hypothetical protein
MVQSKFNLNFWFVSYIIFSLCLASGARHCLYYYKYRVRERIEYRFRVPSAAVFTLYSYSKALEYPTASSLTSVKADSTFSGPSCAVPCQTVHMAC